jgi:hypothetical protein
VFTKKIDVHNYMKACIEPFDDELLEMRIDIIKEEISHINTMH